MDSSIEEDIRDIFRCTVVRGCHAARVSRQTVWEDTVMQVSFGVADLAISAASGCTANKRIVAPQIRGFDWGMYEWAFAQNLRTIF